MFRLENKYQESSCARLETTSIFPKESNIAILGASHAKGSAESISGSLAWLGYERVHQVDHEFHFLDFERLQYALTFGAARHFQQ